jgi:hypothetical protein
MHQRVKPGRLSFLMLAAVLPSLAWSADDTQATAPAQAKVEPPAKAESQAKADERKPPSGWKAKTRGNVLYWCTIDGTIGTRVRQQERCLTPEQYETSVINTQKAVEDMRRTARPPQGG